MVFGQIIIYFAETCNASALAILLNRIDPVGLPTAKQYDIRKEY